MHVFRVGMNIFRVARAEKKGSDCSDYYLIEYFVGLLENVQIMF